MKKIGLIDLHIDEWHANHYPEWFRTAPSGGNFTLAGAWEESPAPGGKALKAWCEEMQIPAIEDLAQLIDSCDAFCIFAPSNPEVHERLADLALRSGKPTFIDKPFAPDRATALRLFDLAKQYNTPLFSSSALRFADELIALHGNLDTDFMITQGGGSNFEEYCIHQIEMIVSVMGSDVVRLMHETSAAASHVLFEFSDARRAAMTLHKKLGFSASLLNEKESKAIPGVSNMFPNLVQAILEFFETGVSPVCHEETIVISDLVDCASRAQKSPGIWQELTP